MTISRYSRREMLGASAVAGAGLAATACQSAASEAAPVTPPHTEGPFYPVVEQADKDADLTKIVGQDGIASGEIIEVEGRVLDANGAPVAGAVVDIWQANAAGRYDHEQDPNPAPIDTNFQGWAIMTTDENGRYAFKTVRPGAYPVSETWTRPPHIHFKVSRRGYREITTQMYFDGEQLNDVDHLLNELSDEMKPTLVARRDSDTSPFRFDVVLAPV